MFGWTNVSLEFKHLTEKCCRAFWPRQTWIWQNKGPTLDNCITTDCRINGDCNMRAKRKCFPIKGDISHNVRCHHHSTSLFPTISNLLLAVHKHSNIFGFSLLCAADGISLKGMFVVEFNRHTKHFHTHTQLNVLFWNCQWRDLFRMIFREFGMSLCVFIYLLWFCITLHWSIW